MTEPMHPPVPERYHGVWARTLLETPEGRDTTTWVRWLQTSQWHADLRVPAGLDRSHVNGLARQQGFCGITQITPAQGEAAEICTWHRHHDLQPPRSTPDAGTMAFETPERIIERGVHGNYLEVWERLPGSLGRRIVLQGLNASGQTTTERVLITGDYLMHVRPRAAPWPEDLKCDESLAHVTQRHPTQAPALLDFEIAFGQLKAGTNETLWSIEQTTLPESQLPPMACTLVRSSETHASLACAHLPSDWRVIEWEEA
jgi:hypothetical protein